MQKWCAQVGKDVLLKIWLQPGAKKTMFHGTYGEMMKLSVCAAPVEGKANDALIDWITDSLKVKRRHVIIGKGRNGRLKTIIIKNAFAKEVINNIICKIHKNF